MALRFAPCLRDTSALSSISIEEDGVTEGFRMPVERTDPFLPNIPGLIIDNRHGMNRTIQQSIARGYDDLTNGRVRPWKQAKAEADRMRAIR